MTDSDTSNRRVGDEVGEDAKQSAERLAADARSTAEDIGERAREQAWQQADRAKTGVASEMSSISSALRKAADEMKSGSPQERTFGQIADSLADASEAIRDRDLGQLTSDASDFARRNPLAFLGGAALAGFAVSRFAKASSTPTRGRSSSTAGGQSDLSYSDRDEDQRSRGATPATPPDRSSIPGPATAPIGTTPGVGAPATGTPSSTATRTPGES